MKHEAKIKGNSGPGLTLPFILLALGCAVATFTILRDTLAVRRSLTMQIEQAEAQFQQARAKGQQMGAARQHYFALYSDLVALSKTDASAAAVVKKFGIRLDEPVPPQK